ncbi:spermidine/putrescine ABC transporter ATP-binding protein [Acidovorax sp. SRB_14]|uniref:ABC transporter ATP-binding protein n=1 Tax=Acidovorax sp. SRB_14 TaxID=1962699 RepID=UPI001566B264|nr:ABC transporter ATP-binding protein [Acidovorax sp. SRB_14]NMM82731.1 spermidine/putrescine ABC transporter ATP-binding protein [Acidovorax sp. SRB_14]
MPPYKLKISGLSKRYGDFVALAPTDLEVATGEFLTLLGPSGSGKTTLLGLIAGLSVPDGGQLLINGVDVTYGAPYDRDIGMVFQNYALFPHMTIEDNIAFPLKMRKVDSATARKRAHEALELVHLPHVATRFPKELSGGQQQRIALARCLVYRPSIILMDEPLGALDKKLRDQMQLEIKRIHRELGTTIIYVTHDQEEAMTMSDRICLMNGGKIEQLGTPSDLYFRPRTLFVADFLGESNLFAGTVTATEGDSVEIDLGQAGTRTSAKSNGTRFEVGNKVRVMVRPQNLSLDGATNGLGNGVGGKVLDSMITGSLTKLYVASPAAGPDPIVVSFPTAWPSNRYALGQEVTLQWQTADAVAVPA